MVPRCVRGGSARQASRSRRSASAPGRSAAPGARPTTTSRGRAARRGRRRGHFFDTADVYGDGRSERLLGRLLQRAERAARGRHQDRRGAPSTSASYTYDDFRGWLERSRENLGVETVDLVQLHCPPWDAYYTPSVFEACDAARRGRADRALRRLGREGRGGPEGDRVPRRRDRPDRLQPRSASAPPSSSSQQARSATSA